MSYRLGYVPGEQDDELMGGTVVQTQVPGSSQGGSEYAPDNPNELSPSQTQNENQTGVDILQGRDVNTILDNVQVDIPSFAEVRSAGRPGPEINPETLSRGVTDYYAEQNALVSAQQVDVGALASQYDGLIQNLQTSYRLAETEEERQRLRYMLADIEAQYDAAIQTINTTYQAKQENLANRIEEERAYSLDFAQRSGDVFTNLAEESEARLGDISQNLSEQYRGLGLESADSITNEWTQVVRALDPIQTTYLTEAGNNRVATMNRSLESMAMQEMAQMADLERLKAQTTSAAQYRYLEDVEDRINSEYIDMRNTITNITMTKISATQSALEFNATMRDRAAARIEQEPDPTARYDAFLEYSTGSGGMLMDPEEFEQQFRILSRGEAPDDRMWYNFLAEGAKVARGEFNVATQLLNDFLVGTYQPFIRDSQISGTGVDSTIRNELEQTLRNLERDRNEAYELDTIYNSLLDEVRDR